MNWIHRVVLHIAGMMVPYPDQAEWLAEWKAELSYVPDRDAFRFCLGSFQDAYWLQRSDHTPRKFQPLESPLCCLGLLAAVTVIAVLVFALSPGIVGTVLHNPHDRRGFAFVYVFLTVTALLILPTTTTLTLGEYPSGRPRRWIFLFAKLALIFLLVLFGSLDLLPRFHFRAPFLPDLALLGYVMGFRWALVDQRRRCPVCLHLLISPTRFGDASHTLLDLYGTELVCAIGHGLLYVPEIRTSYTRQRWLDLDESWQDLFPARAKP